MWKTTYQHLKAKGVNVYSPGQHKGLCAESYVVLRDGKSSAFAGTNKVGYSVLEVHIYHPMARYSSLKDYKEMVKGHLKELDYLRYTGNETPAIIDDGKQAHAIFIDYQVLKRL